MKLKVKIFRLNSDYNFKAKSNLYILFVLITKNLSSVDFFLTSHSNLFRGKCRTAQQVAELAFQAGWFKSNEMYFVLNPHWKLSGIVARRICRGADKIFSLSKCKNRFCFLLKCVSIIFILNIYVSDRTLTENFRRAVSK